MANRSSIGAFRSMRRIDQYLGPPICLALGALKAAGQRVRGRRSVPTKGQPQKILIIKFWGMGSIVLTTTALRALKKTYPDSTVTFLTFEQNEGVCRMIKSIDHVYPYRANGVMVFLLSLARLLAYLRR